MISAGTVSLITPARNAPAAAHGSCAHCICNPQANRGHHCHQAGCTACTIGCPDAGDDAGCIRAHETVTIPA
jgi:hypothetical protein